MGELLIGLDAFRDDFKAQAVCHGDCGVHQFSIGGIARHVIDKAAVDFQGIEGVAAKIAQ
jgi:hypothetical protein